MEMETKRERGDSCKMAEEKRLMLRQKREKRLFFPVSDRMCMQREHCFIIKNAPHHV